MKPPHGRLTVEPAARALTYHWLCVGCCEYAEDPDGMPAGWEWMDGVPLCEECVERAKQRQKEAKP